MRKLTSRRPATPLPSFPTVVPRPLPPGWTEAEVLALMESVTIDDSAPGALDGYVHDAFWRFLHTWGLVADRHGTALELGANPYFISLLVSEFTELDVTFANYFDEAFPQRSQRLGWVDRDGRTREARIDFDHFNLERDAFPYADGTFDVVLFCEILEHLLMDPLHGLREIHRVLRPDGVLILTTPNVARLDNVFAMIGGTNIYDPYSGFGPYGRHNREYTMAELVRLLRFAGFEVTTSFTADAHPTAPPERRHEYPSVAPHLVARSGELGGYLFVCARRSAPPRPGLPDFLYRSYPAGRLVAAD